MANRTDAVPAPASAAALLASIRHDIGDANATIRVILDALHAQNVGNDRACAKLLDAFAYPALDKAAERIDTLQTLLALDGEVSHG